MTDGDMVSVSRADLLTVLDYARQFDVDSDQAMQRVSAIAAMHDDNGLVHAPGAPIVECPACHGRYPAPGNVLPEHGAHPGGRCVGSSVRIEGAST